MDFLEFNKGVIAEFRENHGVCTGPFEGMPMILITMSQIVREGTGDRRCQEWIDRSIDEIERDFMKPELETVMETVGPGGEIHDHLDGRMLNPGHAIEAGWFVLEDGGGGGDLAFWAGGMGAFHALWWPLVSPALEPGTPPRADAVRQSPPRRRVASLRVRRADRKSVV